MGLDNGERDASWGRRALLQAALDGLEHGGSAAVARKNHTVDFAYDRA